METGVIRRQFMEFYEFLESKGLSARRGQTIDASISYFLCDPFPVRTTVQAKMPLGALIEAEAIAYSLKS